MVSLGSIFMNARESFRFGFVAVLIVSLICINPTSALPLNSSNVSISGPTDPKELDAFMDGTVNAVLKAHHIPGATVSIVKYGQIIFAKGYGYSDISRRKAVVANQTLFRIGSVSKLFIWTAVMQLAEQNKLSETRSLKIR
jgi:CubicO group peptidase (beta-lactamase class C family)